MEGAKTYWSMTEGVFNCLIDYKRTKAFQRAIKNTIKKGDVVVDMGTGTGVLAMFAIDMGAAKVYAIEIDENNIKTLRSNFEVNGYKDKIIILKGDVREVKIPEKADVIIGEMIATGLIEELQIPAMNNMLKYSKENVRVVLNKFENYIDLVNNNEEFYNKKFKVVRYEYADEKELKSIPFSDKNLINRVDFSKINVNNKIDKKISLNIKKDGLINGIRISSKTVFFDGSTFGYSFAYSYPIILPIEEYEVKKGEQFLINLSYEMCAGFNTLEYSIIKK